MKAYYVNLKYPYHEVVQVEIRVHCTEKRVWAILQDPTYKNREIRRLIGTSIFFTIESANRCREAVLRNQVKYTKFRRHPQVYEKMVNALKTLH